ncbi:hypothetical protein [Microvirga terrestris]|uniref:ATP-binding protein n=1 Tax=Microvirga terrestris TaxID=2791024 RepID=A0ABS0HNP8_9HYPH|nr:hypothetical protein [Microvirga terrestris]MBF9195109.1 hypothetical protein [Microvirga terrestris]
MNALQAVQDAPKRFHKVVIDIHRDPEILSDELAPINGFTVSDTGIGFDDDNFDSFNTAFSEYKSSRGGKGLGRFIWLKAFDRVEVDSIFEDSNILVQRKFVFDGDYDPEKAPCQEISSGRVGTVVRLINFKEPYKSECPRNSEQIAQRLIEHFLLVFLQDECPEVEIHDLGKRIILNDIFIREFKSTATSFKFKIKGTEFSLHGFKLTTPRVSKHRLIYAANHRGVVSEKLEDYIPNLTGRLPLEDGSSFVYLAVVQSDYLNQRVNHVRTDFEMASADDSESEQATFFDDEINRSDIREECISNISNDLRDIISSINDLKEEKIFRYVQEDAPQYKVLLKYRSEFIDKISPTASKSELEAALHRELYQREVKLKQEGSRIIKEAEKIDDYEGYQERLSDFMTRYNELGVSALAQHVAHRKIILEFLDRAISRMPDKEQYPLERAVHNIIFPMRTTSDDVPYDRHNLWIIDEKLTYHSFISSDKPLSSIEHIENASSKRPDLFIFDRRVLFSEGGQPINSIIVVEFKRPMRDDYKSDDNPLTQSFEAIEDIRAGKFKNEKGRPISVATREIPAFCYVICDITDSLRNVMMDMEGAQLMPDNQGYYGYHSRRRIYYEIMDYNKLLRDAERRNRIFFDKLNILGEHR